MGDGETKHNNNGWRSRYQKRKRMGLLRVFICNDRQTLKLGAKTEISQTTLSMIVK